VQRAPPHGELFPTAKSEREGVVRLIERLQARLGAAQVQRLVPQQDHRPECATRAVPVEPAGLGAPPTRAGLRTTVRGARCGCCTEPQPLPEHRLRPLLDGQPLHLLCGPERIEAGWWDAALAERDYFIAQGEDGALLWIFRARLPAQGQGWFLQGRFG
jgi:protein ImuB